MINKDSITIVVHDGTFHTDDVCAVAIVALVFKDKKLNIIRTRDEEVIQSADVVIDVGGVYDSGRYRFDHHQKGGAGIRDNGVPYASAGLVWNEFGMILCNGSSEMVNYIDSILIQGIDGPDNGYDMYEHPSENNPRYYSYMIKDIINTSRPTPLEDISVDTAFEESVETMKKILTRVIAHSMFYFYGKQKLEEAYSERKSPHYILTDMEYSGWYEFAGNHPELLYMLYPRTTKGWTAKSALKELGSFDPRKPFPEHWRGLRDDELMKVTGVEGARFCHGTGYMIVADTKEALLQLVENAVQS